MSVVIFFGISLDNIIKTGIKRRINPEMFTNTWKLSAETSIKDSLGFCCNYGEGNTDILIWIYKQPKKLSEYCVLYHELYHAVDLISKDKGFGNLDDLALNEPKTYLFEYLFEKVSKKLWIIS